MKETMDFQFLISFEICICVSVIMCSCGCVVRAEVEANVFLHHTFF